MSRRATCLLGLASLLLIAAGGPDSCTLGPEGLLDFLAFLLFGEELAGPELLDDFDLSLLTGWPDPGS
ncbi:hypothetical protein JYK14_24775 [Siccirubricoccus sp. KC 17139]|uniref:Uncharacterized protein n=1 Tax=Siccirubricoccus soli TaxID=2899147 RepID=A0ABT1DBN4_9PROT|nr:hypothetical protein [Siccirubricoccus soli]MCO6419351.1 hypothetical protein [Siccirubricoccus soli]MCP2685486.1 hypothetical protein [Siccirubricoccus soli]